MTRRVLGLNRHSRLKTYTKDSFVRKFDINLRTVQSVFVDRAPLDHLACELMALNHGVLFMSEKIHQDKAYSHVESDGDFAFATTFQTAGEYHTHRV